MRKICLIFILSFFASYVNAQYPLTQNLASDSSLVRIGATYNGAIKGGLINMSFTDTTAANLSRISFYAGAQIWSTSDSSLYVRQKSATGTFWFKVGGAGGGPTGSFWNLTGNTIAAVPAGFGIGTNSADNLPFKTDNTTRMILPSTGLARQSGGSWKALLFDTIGLTLGYGDVAASSAWELTGNTGTNPSSNWIGTNDSASLSFRVNGRDAGYLSRAGIGPSGIVVNYTGALVSFGQLAGATLIPKVVVGTENGSGNVLVGPGAGQYLSATYDTTASTTSSENVLIGLGSGQFIQKRNFTTGNGRNVMTGISTCFHCLTPGENTGIGSFVMESGFRPLKNTGVGSNSLRTANDASLMTATGAYASAYSGCVIESVTINSSSSDWTTATVTFSAPYSTGSPGDCRVTATGTAVISGGQIIGVNITNPGCGYTTRTGTFYTGYTSYYPTVTITGDGSSVSATVNVLAATGTTSNGHAAGWLSRAPQYQIYFGEGSEPSTRYWDAYGGAIGKNSGIHSSVSPLQKITNGWAFGTNAKVSTDRTMAFGAPVGDTTLKFVYNGHTGDSTMTINGGGLDIATSTGGLRVAGLGSPFTGNSIPMVSSSGSFTPSIITQDVSGNIVRIDDGVRGVTTTNAFPFLVRNSYAGDASSNANSLVLFSTNSSSSTQKYMLRMSATNMPDNSDVSFSLGKTTSTRNIFYWTYHHTTNGSTGNYLEEQFQGVSNIARTYASGNKTIGSSITTDNGYRLEVGGKTRITDTLWGQGGVRFSGLASSSNATDSMMVVDASTGNVGYRAIPSGGSVTPGSQGQIYQTSNGAAAWKYDTTTLVTFTAGANFAADTASFTDSTIYGSFKLMGNDTFYVTGVSAVLYSNNAITDTLGIQITYNDTINVIGSHVFAATYGINNETTGQDADPDDFTGSNSVPIPPGNWVWLKSPTVVAGRKPYYLSVSIIGYKKRLN